MASSMGVGGDPDQVLRNDCLIFISIILHLQSLTRHHFLQEAEADLYQCDCQHVSRIFSEFNYPFPNFGKQKSFPTLSTTGWYIHNKSSFKSNTVPHLQRHLLSPQTNEELTIDSCKLVEVPTPCQEQKPLQERFIMKQIGWFGSNKRSCLCKIQLQGLLLIKKKKLRRKWNSSFKRMV